MTRRRAARHPQHYPVPNKRSIDAVRPRWEALAPLIVAAAGILVYANSLGGAFLFDDLKRIVANRAVRSPGALWEVLGSSQRPVTDLTFAINYQLGGLRTLGYHIVNLLIHVLAGVTLYGVVRRTLLRPALAERHPERHRASAPAVALAVALIWVVHPLQTQAVDYLVQRSESLMGLFYLLALYCVVRSADAARPTMWYVSAVAACALGMGSKAVMVTAPLIVLLYDRLFLAGSFAQLVRQRWGLYVGLAAAWLVLVLCGVAQGVLDPSAEGANVGFGYKGVTPWQYVRTQPEIILHYLRLTFWPAGLCLDYGWPVAESWGRIAASGAVVLALLAAAVWTLFRKPGLGFAGAWFFLILAPTSTIVPIRDLAFEHRMYLPLAAVVLVAVVAGRRVMGWVLDRYAASPSVRREVSIAALVVVVAALGLRTLVRNRDYATAAALWSSVVQVRPNHARAYQNLGFELTNAGRSDDALAAFRRAVELDPGHAESQHSLGRELLMQGQADAAITYLREAVRLDPRHYRAHVNLGLCLARLGQLDEAVEHYQTALAIKPDDVNALYALGAARVEQKRYAEAADAFRAVLRVDPTHANARRTLDSIRRALPQGEASPPR